MDEIEMYIKFQNQRAIIWQERLVTKSLFLAFSNFVIFGHFKKLFKCARLPCPKLLLYAPFIPKHSNNAFCSMIWVVWKFLKNEDF